MLTDKVHTLVNSDPTLVNSDSGAVLIPSGDGTVLK